MTSQPESYVKALYDFEYEKDDGKKVRIDKGELYILLKKTNDDWWQVIRPNVVDRITFYAPASYLEETDDVDLDLDKRCKINDDKGLKKKVKMARKEHLKVELATLLDSQRRDDLKKGFQKSEDKKKEKAGASAVGEPETRPPVRVLIVSNPLRAVEEDRLLGRCEGDVKAVKEDNEMMTANVEEKKNKKNKEISNNSRMKGLDKPLPPRPESPIYANLPKNLPTTPPVPSKGENPLRVLVDGWAEFADTFGRRYYYDEVREKSSWKPPRRRSDLGRDSTSSQGTGSMTGQLSDSDLNSGLETEGTVARRVRKNTVEDTLLRPTPDSDVLPQGWSRGCDRETGEICYVNNDTQQRWFTSADDCGRIYYYQEHSKESFWQLPSTDTTDDVFMEDLDRRTPGPGCSASPKSENLSVPSPASSRGSFKSQSPKGSRTLSDRRLKARSLVVGDTRIPNSAPDASSDNAYSRSSTLPCRFTQQMPQRVVKEGPLFKTKLTESGKRVRKNWTSSYALLTETELLFRKESRQGTSPHGKTELVVDLCGCQINSVENKSSRKNVLEITSGNGQQSFLIHTEDTTNANDWLVAIQDVIDKLVPSEPEQTAGYRRLRHSKSTRRNGRSTESSTEDLDSTVGPSEKKIKIRDKLRSFFQRRPTIESLQARGIIKDEPIFGCNLHNLCAREKRNVPEFVPLCIEAIERKDMKADGLYRASGNLSQVQRMRFRVNQENDNIVNILEEEEDVHVLTGALKLFFRELKEPLFPFQSFERFLNAISIANKAGKMTTFKDLVASLPKPNHATLRFLLEHLNRVTKYHEHNRMHVQNLSIVFGPTLMWPATESSNIASDMMQQNHIVEFLLLEFDNIFR